MSPTFKATKRLTDAYSYSSSHVSLNQEDRDQNERPCTSVFDKLNFADGSRDPNNFNFTDKANALYESYFKIPSSDESSGSEN